MEIEDIEQETESRFLEYISDYNVYTGYRFSTAMFQKFFIENYYFALDEKINRETIRDTMNDTRMWFEQQKEAIDELSEDEENENPEEIYYELNGSEFEYELKWSLSYDRQERPSLYDMLGVWDGTLKELFNEAQDSLKLIQQACDNFFSHYKHDIIKDLFN